MYYDIYCTVLHACTFIIWTYCFGSLAVGTAAMCASLILLLQSIHVVTRGELTPGTGSLAR